MATVIVAAAVLVKSRLCSPQLATNLIRWRENFGLYRTRRRRAAALRAVNKDATEQAFVKTVELDRLIDKMRDSNPPEQLDQLVVENVLALDEAFWIRLATRAQTCKSEDDKKDYEELANCVMSIVDRLVTRHKLK